MDLHEKIMNIQVDEDKMWASLFVLDDAFGVGTDARLAYKLGYRDARHAAAELPGAKPDAHDTGLDFWIEKRAGIGILCGQHEEGGEWCKPASRYEVALWEKLQGLLNQMGPDGKSNFWG